MTSPGDDDFQSAIASLTASDAALRLGEARDALRRAAAAGHADAALFEAAFLANGTGGPRDWTAALARLREAAAHDDVARVHLAAVEAMSLDADGAPVVLPTAERLHGERNVLLYRGIVTERERQLVAAAVLDIMEAAVVVDPASGRQVLHPIRTSDGAVVSPTRESPALVAINRRIAAASATRVEQGEALAVLRYRPGDQYRLHHDAIGGARNQRIKTALVYLNDGYGGGETNFPDLGLRIAGRAGDVIVFDNVDAAGDPDPRMRHAGLPVSRGVKWLATRWIRRADVDPWDPQTLR